MLKMSKFEIASWPVTWFLSVGEKCWGLILSAESS